MAKKNRSIGHIKKLQEGKYLLRLSLGVDDFGKRLQPSKVVECNSDREAEKLLMDFYNSRDELKRNQMSFIPKTLGELYAEWMERYVTKNLRAKTAEWYRGMWKNHISHAKDLRLEIMAPVHIYSIIEKVQGDRMKNGVYKMLKAMINKAVKWGYMATNPCNMIDTPQYKPAEKGTLTVDEIKRIAGEIVKEDLKYQAIYYFAVMCGMRRQEIVGLKWSDIDFNENKITIRRAATQLDGVGTVTDKTKTEKSARSLFLPELLKVILLQLYNQQETERNIWGDKWKNEDWIFTQAGGGIMCLATPTHWWSEFSTKHGIENVTFHGLRHTAATYMIKNNVPISTVSGVLGHAMISTTLNTYTHIIEDTKKSAINIMAELVGGADAGAKTTQKAI